MSRARGPFNNSSWPRSLCYFRLRSGGGGGPSGWHRPVVPLTIKHMHGAAQAVALTPGSPQAVTLLESVRNWRSESALAESTARNITADTTLISMIVLFNMFIISSEQARGL